MRLSVALALLFLVAAGASPAAAAVPATPPPVSAGASVLMYHHIASPGRGMSAADTQYFVDPATFDQQLFYLLSNGYNVVTPDQIVDSLTGGAELPPRAVAITIDDGWQDFWQNGLPVLKKYALPATIFAIADADKGLYMNPAERWALAHSGVTVEAHSLTHPFLTRLLPAIANAEIANSRRALEKELGLPVTIFAYPYGDLNKPVQAMVQAAGYRAAFAAGPSTDETSANLLALPRVMVSYYDTPQTFAQKAADYRWARSHFTPLPAPPRPMALPAVALPAPLPAPAPAPAAVQPATVAPPIDDWAQETPPSP
ncbi:MAG TPA: polysaccharide deacetylase family protein [Chloroflexota bacterium]